MRDFLLSLVNMFRLYVEEDRDNPNNLIIEPRDDYYQETIIDWSDKLDLKQGLEIIPMAELQGRRYNFRYKEDKDYWNEDYQKKYKLDGKSRTYGDKIVDVDNDFVTNEVLIQPIFSGTQMVGYDFYSRVVPAMYASDGQGYKPIGTNPRILYWGGLKDFTGPSWVHYDAVTSSGTTRTQYPYAGHVDDPFNATIDLSFDCPFEVQWKTQRDAILTDNTLYNKYHLRALDEIIDPNSRLVAGWFRLKPTDIFKLSFRKLYRFAGENYRLNKIIDYDLDEERLIKCEFIKTKDTQAFVPTTRFVIGGDSTVNSGGTVFPPEPPRKPTWENLYNPQENVVAGVGNNVPLSSHGVVIVGDDNVVGGDCDNISIIGSDNMVYAGLSNVTLVHCNDLTITEPDQLYINNCLVDECPDPSTALDSRSGQAELIDSTVNVVVGAMTTSGIIIITPVDSFTGMLTVTANAGSFDIDSSIVGESGTVNYFIASY